MSLLPHAWFNTLPLSPWKSIGFEQMNSHFAFLWGPQITQHVCLRCSVLSLWVLGWFPVICMLLPSLCYCWRIASGCAGNPGHKAYQPYKNILRCLIASTAFPVCSVASAFPAAVKFPCALTTVSPWQRLEISLTGRSSTELLIGPAPWFPLHFFPNIYINVLPRFDFCCL